MQDTNHRDVAWRSCLVKCRVPIAFCVLTSEYLEVKIPWTCKFSYKAIVLTIFVIYLIYGKGAGAFTNHISFRNCVPVF